MLRISAVTLFALLAATGCKKDKKTEPAAGSDKPMAGSDKPAAGSDKPAAGSGSAAAGSGAAEGSGSAAAGSGSAAAGSGSAATAPAELKWEKYTSKEGHFTIELPAKPEEQEQGGMKIVGAQFGTTASDNRTAMCGVAYMSLGDAKADPKVMLDGATARHKQNAKVIEEKDVKLGKHPGRSIVVENDSHRKWMRVYIVDKTIYVLNCGGPFDRAAADGPIATKTLDSFALTK